MPTGDSACPHARHTDGSWETAPLLVSEGGCQGAAERFLQEQRGHLVMFTVPHGSLLASQAPHTRGSRHTHTQ